MTPTIAFWCHLFGLLAVESSLLILIGALLCRFLSAAASQRTVWQAVSVGLAILLVCEVSGVGPAVAGLASLRHAPNSSRARSVRVLVNSLPIDPPPAEIGTQDRPANERTEPAGRLQTSWWPGILWLSGAMVLLMRIASARFVFALFRNSRRPVTDPLLLQQTERLVATLGCTRRVRLMESARLSSAIAYGWVRPVICLPERFAVEFTAAQQQAMLAHETAHLAAGDPVWYSISDLLMAFWWWQPLAWWSRRKFHSASEACADDASSVVEHGPRALAECLVILGKRFRPLRSFWALRAEGNGFRSDMGRRVARLLDLQPRELRSHPGSASRTWILGGIIALGLSSFVAMAELDSTSHEPTNGFARSLGARALATLLAREQGAGEQDAQGGGKLSNLSGIPAQRSAMRLAGNQAAGLPGAEPPSSGKALNASNTEKLADLRTRTFRVDPSAFSYGLQRIVIATFGGRPDDSKILNRNSPKTPDEMLERFRDLLGAAGVDLEPPKAFLYNDRSGMFMVRATSEDLEVVEQVWQMVNAAPPQLVIDVKWAEVSEPDRNATDFIALLGLGTDGKPFLPRTIDAKIGQPTERKDDAVTNSTGLFTAILTAQQYKVVLRALEQRAGVDLLSAPRVTTLSGRQAQIKVVDIRTVVTDRAIGVDGKEQLVTKQMEFGPMLDIVPFVNADGYTIYLTAIPTVREFLGYDDKGKKLQASANPGSVVPLPIFRERKMVGSAAVRDGQTMVISPGTIEVTEESGPHAGTKMRKSLFILITATIIDPAGNRVHNVE